MTSIADLPDELVRHILVEFTDRVDRIAAYAVCHLWRRQLAEGRRYCWTLARAIPWTVACEAIATDRSSVARWLLDGRPPPSFVHSISDLSSLLLAAAKRKDDEMVLWLRERGFEWTPETASEAFHAGYEGVTAQLQVDIQHQHFVIDSWYHYLINVDDGPRLVASWKSTLSTSTDWLVRTAVCKGSLSVLRCLAADGRVDLASLLPRAFCAMTDALVVAWALDSGIVKWEPRWAFDIPMLSRISNLLQYEEWHRITGRFPPPDDRCYTRLMIAVALEERMDAIPWIMEHERHHGEDIFAHKGYGAAKGTVDQGVLIAALATLQDRGWLELSEHTFLDAAREGYVQVLEWLHNNRCSVPSLDDTFPSCVCIQNGQPDTLAWLLARGYAVGENTLWIATSTAQRVDRIAQSKVIRLLIEHGCRWCASACDAAIRSGLEGTFYDAIEHCGAPWHPKQYLTLALTHDSNAHRGIARWIAQRARIDFGAFEGNLIAIHPRTDPRFHDL